MLVSALVCASMSVAPSTGTMYGYIAALGGVGMAGAFFNACEFTIKNIILNFLKTCMHAGAVIFTPVGFCVRPAVGYLCAIC